MFCCLDYGSYREDYSGSSFPGNRARFVRTGGNALAKAPGDSLNGNEIVHVIVPPNKYGGDQILVQTPSGKCVLAVIPMGMSSGDTFQVDVPRDAGNGKKDDSMNLNQYPSSHAVTPMEVPAPSAPLMEDYEPNIPINTEISPKFSTNSVATSVTGGNQSTMLVKVPPGCAAGSTIHVQVPGENKLIAAKVPPNVSEFYVAYKATPQSAQKVQIQNTRGQTAGFRQGIIPPSTAAHKNKNNNIGSTNYGAQTVYNENRGISGNTGIYSRQNGYHVDQQRNQNQSKNSSDNEMSILAPILGGAAMLGAAGFMIGHHQNGGGGGQED